MPRFVLKPVLRTIGLHAAALGAIFLSVSQATAQTVFINEVHYNNQGRDTGEIVEIAGPADTDLTDWQLIFYNGKNGRPYRTLPLEGTLPDLQNGYGTLSFEAKGIENGAPDGIALINADKEVVHFLSYEGTFTASAGVAEGLTATDVAVKESDRTTVGQSLQLMGNGRVLKDFHWEKPMDATPGAINAGQTFGSPAPAKAGAIAKHQE